MCLYRPNAQWEGEFEWLKTLQGPQLENCREKFSSGARKHYNKMSNITTCCLGGFQEQLSSLIQKQTPAYSVVRHDWNFKWDWLLWSDETKKLYFYQQTLKMGLVDTRIKSTPYLQLNILLYFHVVRLYFCWRSWTSCLDAWHHGFYQTPTDTKSTSDWLC